MIVVVVIGIIIAFILTAAMEGVRRAEERATQALIAKLEAGISDRLDAIVALRADANSAHAWLAAAFSSSTPLPVVSNNRAQVIARFDQVRSEFPEVFIVQNDTNYPLNFGAAPFPAAVAAQASSSVPFPYCQYLLPLGAGILNDPTGVYGKNSLGGFDPTPPFTAYPAAVPPQTTGIFGASYSAAAGIYKNLVAAAVAAGAAAPKPGNAGYDGFDTDGNGLVDDLGENGKPVATAILALLQKHTHKTARSEMLYAVLVEGQGPYGSVFSRDDFSDSEVKDTDGDGLPEFVDAWGEPLQFYLWPVFYASDSQKGARIYGTTSITTASGTVATTYENRHQYPLDPNQTLVAPFWWSGVATASFAANDKGPYTSAAVTPLSAGAYAFQMFFTTLADPNANAGGGLGANSTWDRGTTWPARRSYYTRPLILSGGPDKAPGVPVLDLAYYRSLSDYIGTVPTGPAFSGANPVPIPTGLDKGADPNIQAIQNLRVESQAAQATFLRADAIYYTFTDGTNNYQFPPTDPISLAIQEAANDDITNQNLNAPGGATQ
jgi:hypothetical protein